MLKSKNQVTLFVNYSCNSFCDFCFSENTFREQKIMCQKLIWDFRFYMGVIYIDIPLTGIYAIGATIFILHRWQLMNCTGAC